MKHAFAIILTTTMSAVPGLAFAACESRGGLICGSGTPRVSSESGLSVSRGGNFAPLAEGTGLRSGDRVLTGDAGATVALGQFCSRSIGPGALVSFTRSGGRSCISVTESTGLPQPPAGEVAGPLGTPAAAVGLAAGAAVAAGIGIALSGDDRRTPPTVSAQ